MPDPNIKKYLESKGTECPFCGSARVFVVPLDGVHTKSGVTCPRCGRKWEDWFELRGILMPDSTFYAVPVTVVIEVRGGVAEVAECPDGVEVIINDLDVEDDEEEE